MTLVEFDLYDANNNKSQARLRIPEKRGMNKHWDYILDNFDFEKMKSDWKKYEQQVFQKQKINNKTQKAAINQRMMSELFNAKTHFLNLPFAKNLSREDKRIIRKAPDMMSFQMAFIYVTLKYVEESQTSMKDLIMDIERHLFENGE